MIKHIATQAIYVSDLEAAEAFWTQKLGFKVTAKHDLGAGRYWLEVAPEGAQTRLVLYAREWMEDWQQRQSSIVFECENVETLYDALRARGVTVGEAPVKMELGNVSTFSDPDGNEFIIRSV